MLYNLSAKNKFFLYFSFLIFNLISIRFFFKYVNFPFLSWVTYLSLTLIFFIILINFQKKFSYIFNNYFIFFCIFLFSIICFYLYPIANNLSEQNRGSVNDDCIKIFIVNIFNLISPYSNMGGYECSLGPSIFIFYFPFIFFNYIFEVFPSITLIIIFFLLKKFFSFPIAFYFTLIQLSNLLFIELSVIGSDYIAIGFVYSLAYLFFIQNFINRKNTTYFFLLNLMILIFSTLRLPFFFISLLLYIVLFVISLKETSFKKILIIVFFFISSSIWLLVFFIDPENFISHPSHLFRKFLTFFMSDDLSTNLWFKLIKSNYFNLIILSLAFFIIFFSIFFISIIAFYFKRFFNDMNLIIIFPLVLFLPMCLISFIDLYERNFNFATWEGLNYIYILAPTSIIFSAYKLHIDLKSNI